MSRRARRSSTRSGRSCGGAASTSARSRRCGDSPCVSAIATPARASRGPGFNLKQGRGGIREIEFFAQTHQLIHGGRDPSLRQRGTRAALDALAAAGVIAVEDATVLGEAYDRLRVVEHRLQMVADQQTHSLPDGAALDGVARLDGWPMGRRWSPNCARCARRVAERYDAMLGVGGPSGPAVGLIRPRGHGGACRAAGPTAAIARSGARRRSVPSRRSKPRLLAAFAAAAESATVLARWETMLERMSSAINVFRLLEARPGLLDLLLDCLTLAPPLADELARKPERLDALIDRSAFALPGSVDELAAEMRAARRTPATRTRSTASAWWWASGGSRWACS